MSKRSAVMVAAGLVLSLIVGGLAVAVGLTGPTVSNAVARTERRSASDPVVRTVRRTVTVHRKAEAKPAEVVQIAAQSSATGSTVSEGSSGSDDSYGEDEDHGENEAEDHGEDHGDDAETDDHTVGSGEDHGDDG